MQQLRRLTAVAGSDFTSSNGQRNCNNDSNSGSNSDSHILDGSVDRQSHSNGVSHNDSNSDSYKSGSYSECKVNDNRNGDCK